MNAHADPNPATEDPAARAREERARNRCLDADTVAAALREKAPDAMPYARRVGAWIWIEFPAVPTAETRAALKALGFSWNSTRGAWQHPGGVFRPKNNKGDPREWYGEEPLETAAALA